VAGVSALDITGVDPAFVTEGELITFVPTYTGAVGEVVFSNWNYGDGTSPDSLGQHVYADNGFYALAFDWSDDVSSGTSNFFVTVQNAAPTLFLGTSSLNVTLGDPTGTLDFTFNDPGTLDTHVADIDWGDGSAAEPLSVSESPFGPPGASVGLEGILSSSGHIYGAEGAYTASVTLTDDDGGSSLQTFLVTVVPPAVPISAADIVTIGSKEWAQPDLFTNLSWNDINTVCPNGVCSGNLTSDSGTYNMDGWTFADVNAVNGLFNAYVAAGDAPVGYPLVGPSSATEFDSTWAADFLTDFRPTYAVTDVSYIWAWTASQGVDPLTAYRSRMQYIVSIALSEANTDFLAAKSGADVSRGAWFYRLVPPTVDLVWKSRNGVALNSSQIVARTGDELEMDIVVSDNGRCTGLDTVALELNWNPAFLTGFEPVNKCVGNCNDNGDGVMETAGNPNVVIIGGNASKYNATRLLGDTPFNSCEGDGDLVLGSIKFLVDQQAALTIRASYEESDGVTVLDTPTLFQPDAKAILLPPGC
jgi:hypothetical protein